MEHRKPRLAIQFLRRWLWLLPLSIAGCSYQVPEFVKTAPPNNPSVAAVRANAETFKDQRVRWGGTIAKLENKDTETWVEIVSRQLGNYGQPVKTDRSEGRFIARIHGFLDPAIYERGRQLTIAGTLGEPLIGKIGEFTYLFPVVDVENYFLWEPEPDVVIYEPYPYWYYDPWYTYPYGYPWRLRHPH